MRVIAIPNPHFPPRRGGAGAADIVLESIAELVPELIAEAPAGRRDGGEDAPLPQSPHPA